MRKKNAFYVWTWPVLHLFWWRHPPSAQPPRPAPTTPLLLRMLIDMASFMVLFSIDKSAISIATRRLHMSSMRFD